MEEKIASSGRYLLAGLTIGWLIGIFFAPKSGEETRDYLSKQFSKGHRHARKKAREFKEPEALLEHGKEMANQKKVEIVEKLDHAVKAHIPGKSKAKGA